MKVWQITRRILYQNRWLYLLLMLWPWAMALLFLVPDGTPDHTDILSILREEAFYGLALVAFTGSAQLGTEERSRRIASVLCRAVSRRQYLLALFAAAWIPLLLYAANFLLSALSLLRRYPDLLPVAGAMTLALALLGLWTSALSVFFSTWMPTWLASISTLGLLSLSYVFGQHVDIGFGPLWGSLMGTLPRHSPSDAVPAVIAASLFFFAAAAIFERRDLNLKAG